METQVCIKCGTEREVNLDNFESQVDGQFNKECKPCRNARLKIWRDSKIKEDPFYSHKKALRELYKTTKEWYDSKLEEQDNHCALCPAFQQTEKGDGKRLSVDHDHGCCPSKRACGKCNRGLLCFNCNKRLATIELLLSDFPDSTRDQAEIYLRNTAVEGSWTKGALRYLKSYEQKYVMTQETQHARILQSTI